MTDHPIAAEYRGLFEAFNAGEVEPVLDKFADDVTWWEIGSSEPVQGKAALIELMQGIESGVEIKTQLHDIVANDDHIIALVNATATRDGESFTYRTAEIFHVGADGKVTERWAFSDDTAAIVSFFSQ